MAVDFRLAYNSGIEIVDLFPQSSIEAVQGIDFDSGYEAILSYSTLNVTIPAPTTQEVTQTIPVTFDANQNNFFYTVLVSTGAQAQSDYNTITQISTDTSNNQLVITRLYDMPQDSIEIMLIFMQGGPINA